MTNAPLKAWQGDFGNAYIDRNIGSVSMVRTRTRSWAQVLRGCGDQLPSSVLEVGANVGLNLRAIDNLIDGELHALEPNKKACTALATCGIIHKDRIYNASGDAIPLEDGSIDMVFTVGVLMHIDPEFRLKTMDEIHRVSRRYIFCAEYFAPKEEEIKYRDHQGMLYRHVYGRLYVDRFAGLDVVDNGFFWKRAGGFDDTNWWLLKKRA